MCDQGRFSLNRRDTGAADLARAVAEPGLPVALDQVKRGVVLRRKTYSRGRHTVINGAQFWHALLQCIVTNPRLLWGCLQDVFTGQDRLA